VLLGPSCGEYLRASYSVEPGDDRCAGPRWYWPRSVYIHIPFCAHHCCYCDFAVVTGAVRFVDAYLDALEREIALTLPEPVWVETIYIGGGTPSFLTTKQLSRLLAIVQRYFRFHRQEVEYTLEANPTDVSDEKLQLLADYGVNRLSLGAQSFDADTLRFLERNHTPATIEKAVSLALQYIPNVSLDLIFAVPGQNLEKWQRDLQQALALGVHHLSAYSLTVEPRTALWTRIQRGLVPPPDQESDRELYAYTIEALSSAGWEHYEISNFARPGFQSRHNLVYWAGEAYFGFGLGAARYVCGTRQTNTRSFRQYLEALANNFLPVAESETLRPRERAVETAALQLRRRSGIAADQFEIQTGFSLWSLLGRVIDRYQARGWLEADGKTVRLTAEGIFYADQICADCIAAGLTPSRNPS
jgi:oxygen-independent coproporphyrinogen-3 oxidase